MSFAPGEAHRSPPRYRGHIDTAPTPLLGRDAEQRALRATITGARNGVSGAVVVRGEPGIGKTALLRAAVEGLDDVLLLRGAGHEAESSLPFGGLQRVGGPLVEYVDDLPPGHATALRIAAGRVDGPPPERFLIGIAMLELLARAARDRPVVLVVDDAHWLDTESLDAFAFVARRLQAEAVALLLAVRDDDGTPDPSDRLAGIPTLPLAGLDVTAAADLLASSTGRGLEPQVVARIVAATGGNPLALVDLAQDLGPRALTDLSWSDDPVPVRRRLEHHYARRAHSLPAVTQRWLLVAAASSTRRTDLVETAARELGCPRDAGRDAQAAGLVRVEEHVRFRHPLVRAAVYQSAGDADRRDAHLALARTATALGLDDVAAWHVAQAAFGTDDDAARLLEDAALRAGRRGGVATRARLLARAADLTTVGPDRTRRFLGAAQAASESGAAHLAHDLLDRAAADGLDPLTEAEALVVRASTAAYLADPRAVVGGTAELVRAADLFHGHDPQREQEALLGAFGLYQTSEWAMQGLTLTDLGRRLRAGSAVAPGTTSVVLGALASLVLDPFPEAAPRLRQALAALEALDDAQAPRFAFVATTVTSALWDERARAAALRRAARVARDTGALRLLDACLWMLALTETERGDPSAGSAYVAQTRELREALGYDAELVVNAAELAWSGAPREHVEAAGEGALLSGFGGAHTVAHAALAARDLAEGRYDVAYERLAPMVARHQIHVTHHQLADQVEAAVRSGHPEVARAASDELGVVARATGSAWALGLAARCRALVATGPEAEPLYREALDVLATSDTPVDLARAHLLFGEWLRRRRRRADAREHLHAALAGFVAVGAPAFAARARAELEAAGGHAPGPAPASDEQGLTARERSVARLAATGQTNAEIGATLFISANTVDYHLRKVFQKLGVTSRRRLRERLGDRPGDRLGP